MADGKTPEDHCCFSVAEIREGLRDARGRAPSEGTLRKQLTRLRSSIAENFKNRSGRNVHVDSVVEHLDGLGYRLRPLGLVARCLG
ncbi:MAG: hypothetical protein H6735_13305 [Alphaproteobacteria bacterium]|nr:hypothetical protein [Alphaproteobacteria bacterium]